MRENKFRIWDDRRKRYLHELGDIRMNVKTGELHGRLSDGNVDEWKAEQYTGLKDATKWEELTEKEKSDWTKKGNPLSEWEGKEIYEGDILFIESCFDSETFNIPVIYKDGCFQAEGSGMLSIVCSLNTPKVVGCIHDEVEVIK